LDTRRKVPGTGRQGRDRHPADDPPSVHREEAVNDTGIPDAPLPPEGGHAIRVGTLARRTGLTVRTLHHYEAVGLLPRPRRTAAGHRLYGPEQIRRLYQVLALRNLGLSLGDVRRCLQGGGISLEAVLRNHLERVGEQMGRLRDLSSRLERMLDLLTEGGAIETPQLLDAMERMTMIEEYYTPEQLEELKARGETLGPEAIKEAEAEWPRLIARMREKMDQGDDPASPEVQSLANRWRELVNAFTGGNPEIAASLRQMFSSEPEMAAQQGLDPQLFQYVGRALQALPDTD
jgi:DNA-binding transcriptional MerR regulator